MMPSEYETLVAALRLTNIPFAEYAWRTRPDGIYGVTSLDMESGSLNGDGMKQDRSWEASVDVFFPRLADRTDAVDAVEEILGTVCGAAWYLNSVQYEQQTGLFHYEWVCTVTDEPENGGHAAAEDDEGEYPDEEEPDEADGGEA